MNNAERRRLKLRLLMLESGLTTYTLASIMGVRPQTARMWTCGLRASPTNVLSKVKDYLREQRRLRRAAA